MSEYAPITGELRDTLERCECTFTNSAGFEQVSVTKAALDSMLDAIDAVHAGLERENAELRAKLDNVTDSMHETDAWKLGYDGGFASADDWLTQHEDAMAEHGWYRALDSDGVPTRIGDKMDSDHYEDGTVTGVQFYEIANGGIRTLIAVRPDGWDVPTWHTPDGYRHHHAPTVEDVLREMHAELDEVTALYVGEAIDSDERDRDEARIFAEYAKRLTLAGDAE